MSGTVVVPSTAGGGPPRGDSRRAWTPTTQGLFACYVLLLILTPSVTNASTNVGQDQILRGAPASNSQQPTNLVHAMQRILAVPYEAGPIIYKTAEAALWTLWANLPNTPRAIHGPSFDLKMSDSSNLLVGWIAGSATLVMAFQGISDAHFNATHLAFAPTSEQSWLEGSFLGAYSPAAFSDPYLQLVQNPSLNSTISKLSGNQAPRRVLCTGYRTGGAYAQLCGVWAAVNYPKASIRSISFGANQVGNAAFIASYKYLVDLSYLWTSTMDLVFTSGANKITDADDGNVYLLNDTMTKTNTALTAGSLAYYVTAVDETFNATNPLTTLKQSPSSGNGGSSDKGSCSLSDDDGCDLLENIQNTLGSVGNAVKDVVGKISTTIGSVGSLNSLTGNLIDTVKAYAFRGAEATALDAEADQIAATARAGSLGCPVILCKVRPAASAACNSYHNGTGTIAPGSITILSKRTGAALALAWDAPTTTAFVAFRGSSSQQDWEYDFKGLLTTSKLTGILQQTFPGVQVHEGFVEQFQSVTDMATTPAENLTAVLYQLSGGKDPTRFIITGHSLGGALATVGAPWFALNWPGADIVSVTFGSPMPGNKAFQQALKAVVGRQMRVIHALDVVPALPPLDSYSTADFGIWIPKNKTVVLEVRPPKDFATFGWNDHNCRAGYEANVYSAPNPLPAMAN